MSTIRDLIDQYLRLRLSRTSPPSATGFQLDKLRLGLPASNPNQDAELERQMRFAHLVYLFERPEHRGGLTGFERDVIFALRTPCGQSTYERQVRTGELEERTKKNVDGTFERWQETRHGERYIRACRDEQGELVEGWSWVEGVKPLYPTREQVAEHFRVTFAIVKRAIRTAYAKLRETASEARKCA